MKKRILSLVLAATLLIGASACGKPSNMVGTLNPKDYVTLGEYKDLEVEVEITELTDSYIDTYAQGQLEYYVNEYNLFPVEKITDRDVIQTGDVVIFQSWTLALLKRGGKTTRAAEPL